MLMHIHAWEPASRANGPGLRTVVWFQGCTIGCPNCFNPDTHAAEGGEEIDTADLWHRITSAGVAVEGVTFSGGEPFQQPEALLDLARRFDETGLSVLIFSGYTKAVIDRMPLGPAILRSTDVLVAGPYRAELHAGSGLLGSSNQQIHLLTPRHFYHEFTDLPPAEIVLHRDGSVTLTGISPLTLRR